MNGELLTLTDSSQLVLSPDALLSIAKDLCRVQLHVSGVLPE